MATDNSRNEAPDAFKLGKVLAAQGTNMKEGDGGQKTVGDGFEFGVTRLPWVFQKFTIFGHELTNLC